jgi:hypothetical protein
MLGSIIWLAFCWWIAGPIGFLVGLLILVLVMGAQ